MAVTRDDAELQSFSPRWPDLSELSPDRIGVAYDGPANTLVVDFLGEAKPAASVALDLSEPDYCYLQVDVETEEVVGLQIEHFLAYAIAQHPWLARALDIARSESITASEVPLTGQPASANGSLGEARMELVGELVRLGR